MLGNDLSVALCDAGLGLHGSDHFLSHIVEYFLSSAQSHLLRKINKVAKEGRLPGEISLGPGVCWLHRWSFSMSLRRCQGWGSGGGGCLAAGRLH